MSTKPRRRVRIHFRDIRGRPITPKNARFIAAQVTTLPIAEPKMPDFATRGEHWHSHCIECYGEHVETPTSSLWTRLRDQLAGWASGHRLMRILERHDEGDG